MIRDPQTVPLPPAPDPNAQRRQVHGHDLGCTWQFRVHLVAPGRPSPPQIHPRILAAWVASLPLPRGWAIHSFFADREDERRVVVVALPAPWALDSMVEDEAQRRLVLQNWRADRPPGRSAGRMR